VLYYFSLCQIRTYNAGLQDDYRRAHCRDTEGLSRVTIGTFEEINIIGNNKNKYIYIYIYIYIYNRLCLDIGCGWAGHGWIYKTHIYILHASFVLYYRQVLHDFQLCQVRTYNVGLQEELLGAWDAAWGLGGLVQILFPGFPVWCGSGKEIKFNLFSGCLAGS